jgi:hypothetical protein
VGRKEHELPEKVIWATHALLTAWEHMNPSAPLKTAEVFKYLEGRMAPRRLGDALRAAANEGLAEHPARGIWVPTACAWAMRAALEDFTLRRWAFCDVCTKAFKPATDGQLRCSEACREFVRRYKKIPTEQLPKLWAEAQAREGPCPSGKVAYPDKKAARKGGQGVTYLRYSGCPGWIDVYQCGKCSSWHLTSKPQRA